MALHTPFAPVIGDGAKAYFRRWQALITLPMLFVLLGAAARAGISLSAPSLVSVQQGQQVSASIQLSKSGGGKPEAATFTVTGLPSGMSAKFAPASCKPGCTTTLTVATQTTLAAGDYSITIRAQAPSASAFRNMTVRVTAISGGGDVADFYVSPSGSGSTCTIGSPCTLATALGGSSPANAGDTIFARGGTYVVGSQINVGKSGSAGNLITIQNYPGETPVLDAATTTGLAAAISVGSSINYWEFKGLEIKNAAGPGMHLSGSASNITIENNNIHHNLRLGTSGGGLNIEFGSNLLVLNNDLHHNGHLGAEGGSGFNTASTASGNVFRGNRCWRNVDNGVALFTAANWLIENNWVWENGYDDDLNSTSPGDGVAFKLGGLDVGGSHVVRYNLAWNNRANGFDVNTAPDPMTVYSNTARNNGGSNFLFYAGAHVLRNNLAHGSVSISAPVSATFNSWNLGVTVSDADFVSTDFTANTGARQADGSLPNSNFLKLVSGSDLVNAGTDVGLPYSGAAPDLGAFEFDANAFAPTAGATALAGVAPRMGLGVRPVGAIAIPD